MAPQSVPPDFFASLSHPMDWAIQHWREEMEVIIGAPIAFTVAVLVIGGVVWKASQTYYKKRIEDLEGRLEFKEEQIRSLEYKGEHKGEGTSILSLSRAHEQETLIIHSALYGLGARHDIDVTERLREVVENGEVHLRVDPKHLGCEDPYPGQIKSLRVRCSYGEKKNRTIHRHDYEYLNLPRDVGN